MKNIWNINRVKAKYYLNQRERIYSYTKLTYVTYKIITQSYFNLEIISQKLIVIKIKFFAFLVSHKLTSKAFFEAIYF